MVGLKPSSSRKIPPQRFPLREMLSDSRGRNFHDSCMHLGGTLVSSGGRTLSQNSWQGVCVVFSSWIGAACVLHVKARCARRRKIEQTKISHLPCHLFVVKSALTKHSRRTVRKARS